VKIKFDENLPAELVADFRTAGIDAVTVGDQGLTGSADAIILDAVRREGRIIMTMDKGIADVRAYPPNEYPGIILIRSASAGRSATMSLVRRHLPALIGRDLQGRLLVLTERGIRQR
jgi:predicted nuclease of predicted toxin-antitoxin system